MAASWAGGPGTPRGSWSRLTGGEPERGEGGAARPALSECPFLPGARARAPRRAAHGAGGAVVDRTAGGRYPPSASIQGTPGGTGLGAAPAPLWGSGRRSRCGGSGRRARVGRPRSAAAAWRSWLLWARNSPCVPSVGAGAVCPRPWQLIRAAGLCSRCSSDTGRAHGAPGAALGTFAWSQV